jgi:hypothetical protein
MAQSIAGHLSALPCCCAGCRGPSIRPPSPSLVGVEGTAEGASRAPPHECLAADSAASPACQPVSPLPSSPVSPWVEPRISLAAQTHLLGRGGSARDPFGTEGTQGNSGIRLTRARTLVPMLEHPRRADRRGERHETSASPPGKKSHPQKPSPRSPSPSHRPLIAADYFLLLARSPTARVTAAT